MIYFAVTGACGVCRNIADAEKYLRQESQNCNLRALRIYSFISWGMGGINMLRVCSEYTFQTLKTACVIASHNLWCVVNTGA